MGSRPCGIDPTPHGRALPASPVVLSPSGRGCPQYLQEETETMPLGIALLGTGSIADQAFAPAVQATAGAQLVAVLSRDQRRGAAFAQRHAIPEVYDDLATLLRNP